MCRIAIIFSRPKHFTYIRVNLSESTLLEYLISLINICTTLNICSLFYIALFFVFFSEELLLQDDSSDMNSMTSEFIKGMHLNQPLVSTEAGRSSRILNAASMQRSDLYSPEFILKINNAYLMGVEV